MNGIHDLGGMQGFGPIEREEHEPVFHAPWEGRVCAMMRAGLRLGLYNLDEFRWALERMDPARYLAAQYFEKWLSAIERLYTEKGVITRDDLDARVEHPRPLSSRTGTPPDMGRVLNPAPSTARHTAAAPPRFHAGDHVVAKNIHPRTHTRLPRYVRGKRGVVDRVHGAYVLPDRSALGGPSDLEPVYSVRFDAQELWGAGAAPRDRVYIDLWESYLDKEGSR